MKKYRNILVTAFIAAASIMAVSCLKDEEYYQDEQGVSTAHGTIVLPYTLTDPSLDILLTYRDNTSYWHILSIEETNPAAQPYIGVDHPTEGGGIYTGKIDTVSLSNYTFDHTQTIHYDSVPVGEHSIKLHCPMTVNKGNKSYHNYYLYVRVPVINLDTMITNQYEEYGSGYDYTFNFTVPNYKK